MGEGNPLSPIPGQYKEAFIPVKTEAAADMCVDVAWPVLDFKNNTIQQCWSIKFCMKLSDI